MAEPTTSAAAFFSITKVWSIIASVCGSVIPVIALSDRNKVTLKTALFMAATGSSFAIFVGPWVAIYFNIVALEAIAGLSWTMGVLGVYVIRAILKWLETRGVSAMDRLFAKATGTEPVGTVQDPEYTEKRNQQEEDFGKGRSEQVGDSRKDGQ